LWSEADSGIAAAPETLYGDLEDVEVYPGVSQIGQDLEKWLLSLPVVSIFSTTKDGLVKQTIWWPL